MPNNNIITGKSEEEVWKIITDQLNSKDNNHNYTAQFPTEKHIVTIDIDIHPDGGDENGKQLTSFSAELPEETNFRFSIEKQGLKHRIGKLFGMQDVIVGHPEFDKKFLIQSNNVARVKEVLSDARVSGALLEEPVVDFEVREHKIGGNKKIVLALDLDGAITEPTTLQNLFQPFKIVLDYLD